MGSIHRASCGCGFETEVTVGGGMRDFREKAPFPFYCERCGLVSINAASEPRVCPTCRSAEVHQYRKPPVSEVDPAAYPVVQHFSFKANASGNLCPACKQMTLVFHWASLLFD